MKKLLFLTIGLCLINISIFNFSASTSTKPPEDTVLEPHFNQDDELPEWANSITPQQVLTTLGVVIGGVYIIRCFSHRQSS